MSTTRPILPEIDPTDLLEQPIERASTIPAEWSWDPAFHALDREHIFARQWHYVGHVSQVPKPGSYLPATVAENPILIVRDLEGELRAFYNVCRHRAGPLATEPGCVNRVVQCKYHGWAYTLDGALRGVPHWDRVDLFDKKDFGLLPVALTVWEGMMFANLDEHPEPFDPVTAGIRERIAPIDLGALTFHSRLSYPIACNWKVYVDNYLEGYHVPIVHPELNKVLDYNEYVTETYPRYSLQYSPFRQDVDTAMYGPTASEAFYYFIFPNLMLNIIGGRLQTNLVLPVDANHCVVVFDYLYVNATAPEAQAQIAADIAYSEDVQREDIEVCEQVQVGLRSRAYRTGRFSVQREEGVHHFQAWLKGMYRGALAAAH